MTGEWVLLWSGRQNALHIETVERMLAANRRDYRDNKARDYVPLVIGTRELCEQTAESVRPTLAKRDTRRGLRLVRGGAA